MIIKLKNTYPYGGNTRRSNELVMKLKAKIRTWEMMKKKFQKFFLPGNYK